MLLPKLPKPLSGKDQATLRRALQTLRPSEFSQMFTLSRETCKRISKGEPVFPRSRTFLLENLAEYRSYRSIRGQSAESPSLCHLRKTLQEVSSTAEKVLSLPSEDPARKQLSRTLQDIYESLTHTFSPDKPLPQHSCGNCSSCSNAKGTQS